MFTCAARKACAVIREGDAPIERAKAARMVWLAAAVRGVIFRQTENSMQADCVSAKIFLTGPRPARSLCRVRHRIDHHACGNGQVQAIGAAAHRNLDVDVTGGGQGIGQTRLLVPHQDQRRGLD